MTRKTIEVLCCSFCGRGEHQVRTLVAGPDAYICDECLAMAHEICLAKLYGWEHLAVAKGNPEASA